MDVRDWSDNGYDWLFFVSPCEIVGRLVVWLWLVWAILEMNYYQIVLVRAGGSVCGQWARERVTRG